MEKIVVQLGKRSYPIVIGSSLFFSFFSLIELSQLNVFVLITDDHVAPIYLNVFLESAKRIGICLDYIILPSGEFYKSLNTLEYIVTELLRKGYNRNVILLALGGGVIGDVVGFASSVYQRGVRFVQVPTTLLAQVDASIGGKTAINHVFGKNMIGSFYQPVSVIMDLDCLYTLPCREFSSGLAEVIKYAIAFDSIFFEWLECHIEDILKLDVLSLSYCVRRCCELKSRIVENDEYDTENGVRVLLNLGHTYGHAIESYFKYSQEWLHGEAVSVGLIMAANLSCIFGYFNDIDFKRVQSLLLRACLPVVPPSSMQVEDYLFYMMRDKKRTSDQLSLVLPIEIGKSKMCINIKSELVESSIRSLKK